MFKGGDNEPCLERADKSRVKNGGTPVHLLLHQTEKEGAPASPTGWACQRVPSLVKSERDWGTGGDPPPPANPRRTARPNRMGGPPVVKIGERRQAHPTHTDTETPETGLRTSGPCELTTLAT